jgi:hypothetical protein
MHFKIKKILSLSMLSILISLSVSAPVSAAKPAPTPLGNDISWPQCGRRLPTGQAFGIVGVNNGLANNTNPCFAEQLAWANKSVGGTSQPKVALYVNTANPGAEGSWWPTSDVYGGTEVANPYGDCTGKYDTACAFIYGYAKAYDDTTIRGVVNPSNYLWWLDVETTNSWQADKVANTADLEGMVTHFKNIGAPVGIYSTNYQWSQIVGTVPAGSNLNNLRSWIAGAANETDAKSMCRTAQPLTADSLVVLVQFVSKNLDYDYSCIQYL